MVGTNGLDLIKIIRQENSNIPIVITSACTDTDYLLDAIPLGLIDYLVKPISYEVLKNSLLKCLEVLIRAKDNIILFKNGKMYNFETNLLLDSSSKIIKLQYKEKLLLNLLIENQNKTTSYYQIEEYIWEGMELNKGTLKVLIVKLRKKIGKDTIITENGLGYRLVL